MRQIALTMLAGAALGTLALSAQTASITAIRGARIVPVSGPVIDNGTVVWRDQTIVAVGTNVTVPAGAYVIEGKGLTVSPGLIDMGSTVGLAPAATPRAEAPRTTEDVERVKADYLRRAHFRAADIVDPKSPTLTRAAAAGITGVLATPPGDAFTGQSALITTGLPPDEPQIGAIADPRRSPMVLRAPVALHVTFSDRPAMGNAYPNSLMGVIAFVRQTWLDAQHHGRLAAQTVGPRPPYDPALDALQPALDRRLPVAFRGDAVREIGRALDMAKAFSLDPIIVGGREADRVIADLKAANARVILGVDYPTRPVALAPDADEPLSVLRSRAAAPKTAAALASAGVPFAFASIALENPADFRPNAMKTVQNGLSRDVALRALTLQAATMAGVADRLGSIENGKLANLVVTEGDLLDEKATIRHVFVMGAPVNLEAARSSGR